jgi:hypothetical protein
MMRDLGQIPIYIKAFPTVRDSDPDTDFAITITQQSNTLPTLDFASNIGTLKTSLSTLQSTSDSIIIEGPAHTTIPHSASTKLANKLGAKSVIVLDYHNKIGPSASDSADGIIINSTPKYRSRELSIQLSGKKTKLLGIIPEDRSMSSISLEEIANQLGAQWIVKTNNMGKLVTHFLIGGNIMDKGHHYFGRYPDKVVVVRGDRPDIQLSALGSPLSALILTGDHPPTEYVLHESQQLEVPLMISPLDTASTIESIGKLLPKANPYHHEKVVRFKALLEKHCNIDKLQFLLS